MLPPLMTGRPLISLPIKMSPGSSSEVASVSVKSALAEHSPKGSGGAELANTDSVVQRKGEIVSEPVEVFPSPSQRTLSALP